MTFREWKLYDVSELLENMANRLTLIKTFPNLYISKSAAKFFEKIFSKNSRRARISTNDFVTF